MQFVTIKQFIKLTGIPDKTVRLALGDGRLKGKKFGKRWLINYGHFIDTMKEEPKPYHVNTSYLSTKNNTANKTINFEEKLKQREIEVNRILRQSRSSTY